MLFTVSVAHASLFGGCSRADFAGPCKTTISFPGSGLGYDARTIFTITNVVVIQINFSFGKVWYK